tara:strand:+ start:1802 stop:2893 length:1092 start_codon:yes stop_codon:yes gene_type:complete
MIAPYENQARGLASLGRFEDTYIVHAAEGETVIPKEVLAGNPKLKEDIFKQMRAVGIDQPESYVVGNALNSINPNTGQPEFFFKKLKRFLPTIGAIVGNIIAPGIGGAIGSGLGSLAAGEPVDKALINAGVAYVGGKYVAPEIDKAVAGFSGGTVPTVGSTIGSGSPFTVAAKSGLESIGSAAPSFLSSAGATIPQVVTAGLSPLVGKEIAKLAEPLPIDDEGMSRQQIVDNYYAALARGENPELPPELTPPPRSSLIGLEQQAPPSDPKKFLADVDYEALLNNILSRQMFLNAAGGGYIKGPGTPISDSIPVRVSNTEFINTGKSVAGADPTGQNNPDKGAVVMEGIMRAFEKRADKNARMA